MSQEKIFKALLNKIENAEMIYRPTQQEKLKMYGLFKQIHEGNVFGEKPGITQFVERAKYMAWERCKDMTEEDAMSAYIALFDGKE